MKLKNYVNQKNLKNFYWFEPTGSLLESLEMPWISPQWLEIERKSMPIKVFNRFRKNLWVDGRRKPIYAG